MGRRRLDEGSIGSQLRRSGVSRREFLEFCSKLMVAAPFGLALTNVARAEDVAREVKKARRLSVVWLHFQDCTGCTESLLRTSKPDLSELILQLVSLDYHETIMARPSFWINCSSASQSLASSAASSSRTSATACRPTAT